MSFEGGGHGAGEGSLHDRRSSDNGGGADGGRINVREQVLKIALAVHALYLAFNGLMYAAIQIHYQNQRKSPFETHMVMKSSLVALFVYFCAAVLQIMLVQTNKELDDLMRLLNHILVCSGFLSLLSNVMVFFPNRLGYIVIIVFVFATTILLAYDVFKLISICILQSTENSSHNEAHESTEASSDHQLDDVV